MDRILDRFESVFDKYGDTVDAGYDTLGGKFKEAVEGLTTILTLTFMVIIHIPIFAIGLCRSCLERK